MENIKKKASKFIFWRRNSKYLFIYLFCEKYHQYWEDAGYSQVSIFYYYYYFLWPPTDRKFKLSEERNVCLSSASYVLEKACSPPDMRERDHKAGELRTTEALS